MKYIAFLWIFILFFSCNSDEGSSACRSNPEFEEAKFASIAYTNLPYQIKGNNFCASNLQKVFVNNIEVPFSDILDSIATFTVPSINADFLTLIIQTNSAKISINKQIAIVKSGGMWKEIAPFPSTSQSGTQTFAYKGKGYIVGGKSPTLEPVNKMYEFDPLINSWKLFLKDDVFESIDGAAILGDALYFNASTFCTLDMRTHRISRVNILKYQEPSIFVSTDMYLYSVGKMPWAKPLSDSVYVQKFDKVLSEWKILGAYNPYSRIGFVNCVITYDGKVYVIMDDSSGYMQTAKKVKFVMYSLGENGQLISEGMIESSNIQQSQLRHLFTIDHQAYFREAPGYSLSEENNARTLVIYDFRTKSWSKAPHKFPEGFFRFSSFTIDNRGFAGLSLNWKNEAGSWKSIYSTKFYEFIPN